MTFHLTCVHIILSSVWVSFYISVKKRVMVKEMVNLKLFAYI